MTPPQPDPPAGYRWLQPGEPVQKGDMDVGADGVKMDAYYAGRRVSRLEVEWVARKTLPARGTLFSH